jgi:2-polyprenyl-6-methoxyphenol hydroxylase-like FAD-dependent oxidoreductase
MKIMKNPPLKGRDCLQPHLEGVSTPLQNKDLKYPGLKAWVSPIKIKNKNILISGAGVAGLSLAYWLKKYGFSPTLVEKHPVLRTEGYKLDIRGKAVEVIKRMGLHQAIYDARTDIQRALFVDDSGKVLKEVKPDLCGARVEGDLEIVRGELCRILFQQAPDVPCLFGDSIKSLTESECGVHVAFEKNEPRLFDLVIGADGLHSRVRKLGFGEEERFLRELGLYISFYSIPNFLHLDRVEMEYHSSKRFAIVYSPRDGMAKAGFAFSSKRPKMDLREQVQQQKFLCDAFEDAGWEIPRLLSFMKETPDFYFDCMAQVNMPHWTKGRIALAGDAAYAVSPVAGQGASVALIGAYVLAGELAEAQGDYSLAFLRYEEALEGFIRKNQQLADMSVAIMEQDSSSMIKSTIHWLMDHLGRLAPGFWIQFWKNLGMKRTAKAAHAIVLKDYC